MVDRANSPGISFDTLPDNLTADQYLNEINSIKNDSLHAKLISIGDDLGFYNTDSNSGYYCELSRGDQYLVIKRYLEDVINLSEDDYSIDTKMNLLGYTSNTVKNWAIEKINAGIPVLLSVFPDNENNSSVSGDSEEDTKEGHFVVGYDVDDDGNILCHFGWRYPLYTRETPEAEGYTYYDAAIALDFNIEHSCSDNYAVCSYDENYNEVTNYYCYHHKDIITYNHICDFSYSSSPLESTNTNRHLYHAAYCHCTNSIAVEHYYFNLSCTKCGYQCEHKYSYTCVDDLTHRGVCQYCTHTKLGRHVFRIGSRTCLECYAVIFDGFIAHPFSIAIAYSANGSYILSNGCIMLAPADIESYFKGTLVFNNSNAVPEIM